MSDIQEGERDEVMPIVGCKLHSERLGQTIKAINGVGGSSVHHSRVASFKVEEKALHMMAWLVENKLTTSSKLRCVCLGLWHHRNDPQPRSSSVFV